MLNHLPKMMIVAHQARNQVVYHLQVHPLKTMET